MREPYGVSVIIPAFNSSEFIQESIESVLNQTYQSLEVVVVDDGSTDTTAAIAHNLATRDNRVRLVSRENGGLSSARNLGFLNAKFPMTVFLDSDDLLDEQCLETCVAAQVSSGAQVVLFNTEPFAHPPEAKREEVKKRLLNLRLFYGRSPRPFSNPGPAMFQKLLTEGMFLQSACLYMFNSDLMRANDIVFMDGVIMEDNLFTPQLLLSAQTVHYSGQLLHRRRVRSDSLSFARTEESSRSLDLIATELRLWTESRGLDKETLAAVSRFVSGLQATATRDRKSLDQAVTSTALKPGWHDVRGDRSGYARMIRKVRGIVRNLWKRFLG